MNLKNSTNCLSHKNNTILTLKIKVTVSSIFFRISIKYALIGTLQARIAQIKSTVIKTVLTDQLNTTTIITIQIQSKSNIQGNTNNLVLDCTSANKMSNE